MLHRCPAMQLTPSAHLCRLSSQCASSDPSPPAKCPNLSGLSGFVLATSMLAVLSVGASRSVVPSSSLNGQSGLHAAGPPCIGKVCSATLGQGHLVATLQVRAYCLSCHVAAWCRANSDSCGVCGLVPSWGTFRQRLAHALALSCAVLRHRVIPMPATFVSHDCPIWAV